MEMQQVSVTVFPLPTIYFLQLLFQLFSYTDITLVSHSKTPLKNPVQCWEWHPAILPYPSPGYKALKAHKYILKVTFTCFWKTSGEPVICRIPSWDILCTGIAHVWTSTYMQGLNTICHKRTVITSLSRCTETTRNDDSLDMEITTWTRVLTLPSTQQSVSK